MPHHVNNGSAQGKPFLLSYFWYSLSELKHTSFIVKNRNRSLNGFLSLASCLLNGLKSMFFSTVDKHPQDIVVTFISPGQLH